MRREHLKVVAVVAALSASHLLASSLVGLGDAEALYFGYSRHLSLSYLDHPPLIGWLIALSTAVGGAHPVAVRFVPLLMTALTVTFTFFLTRDAFGKRAADWSVLLLLATPVFSVGMTAAAPDAPLAAL
jgi:dolichol-phosphate mannosyltransferase